jgi:site-specific recombinase XerD
MKVAALGPLIQAYFLDHLRTQKGLLPASIRTYRDILRLFLAFVSADARSRVTRLSVEAFTFERAQKYLRHLEDERHNQPRTRNHHLAVLHSFFDYLATRVPEMLAVCERVAAIPMKRAAPPQTPYLERDQTAGLFRNLPSGGRHALRDRALLLFLYNTGARVTEVADLRFENLDLGPQPRVQLHGKGDKWRACPLWAETAECLRTLVAQQSSFTPASPVFESRPDHPLTRFGIYKVVRRHTAHIKLGGSRSRHVSPHVFRHTAAVHLLDAGVDVNVIRGWLGHASLQTTNRYAEITTRAKEAALRACEPSPSAAYRNRSVWRDDPSLLAWLKSL